MSVVEILQFHCGRAGLNFVVFDESETFDAVATLLVFEVVEEEEYGKTLINETDTVPDYMPLLYIFSK